MLPLENVRTILIVTIMLTILKIYSCFSGGSLYEPIMTLILFVYKLCSLKANQDNSINNIVCFKIFFLVLLIKAINPLISVSAALNRVK